MKHIVVLGGAFAGVTFIQTLEKLITTNQATITLIEPHDGWYSNIASPRAIVDASVHDKMVAPYTKLLKHTKHVRARAVALYPYSVLLDNGDTIGFDYLLIATGTAYPAPIKPSRDATADIIQDLQSVYSAVKAANSVLIVGGGSAGVEVAGEIAQDYPDKKVTLVHGGSGLVPGFKPAFQQTLLRKLNEMGVQVLLDDRLNLDEHDTQIGWKGESRTLVTTSGKAIQSDVQLFTVGNHAFNTRMVESLGKEVLDEHGRVCVSPTLQLESFLHIFAAGDVANLDESTTAYAARQQAEIAAQNVYALIMGNKLQKASPAPKIAAVPLGRKRGSTLLPFGILGDWFTSRVKGSDMFLTKHNAFPN